MLVFQITEIVEENTLIEFGKFTGSTVSDLLTRWYGTAHGDPEMFKWFCWMFAHNSQNAIKEEIKENYELVKELLLDNMTEEDLSSFCQAQRAF